MASVLLLLHILPPQPSKKKKTEDQRNLGHGPSSCISQGMCQATVCDFYLIAHTTGFQLGTEKH